jgi:GGDEF domain-containing protein
LEYKFPPMKWLRFWIAILSIWLVFFFNIERIFFDLDFNIIRLDTYIFVAFVALATFLLPRLKILSFSFLLVCVASLFLIFWYQDPNWEQNVSRNFTHLNATVLLTIIQVNAIILTGLLARQITYGLSEFENVIANITFGHIGKRPGDFSEEQSVMYRELRRARRYGRPLAVIALKVDEETFNVPLPKIVEEVQQAMMKEYTLAGISRILDSNLQSFDTIALRDNCFIVLLPETADQISQIGQRLEKAIKDNMGIQVGVGAASFPNEAMTFESLVELAMVNAKQSEKNRIRTMMNHKQQAITQEA